MMSVAHQTDFYVTGGTLRRDAPSYVQRQADLQLYSGLTEGKFCYVLTSRQMGKSSLMVRTAARLRAEGISVAVLDLTAIGQNLTAEQWYDGLVTRIGQQLDLEELLDSFWLEHVRIAPLQRLMRAIREVVLIRNTGKVVIFVDEIDAVRSLPFSTDEFFAAVREVYNRRSEDEELVRLNFCLLGVASPSDLVRDTRTTPFNIGQRIELTDFSAEEAAPLARGLGRTEQLGKLVLKRVLRWTGGHPYLTQRLCQAIAQDESVTNVAGVDRVCEELFLTARSRERDDNLLFVRERLLRGEVDLTSLLDLYSNVRSKKPVRYDDTNPLIDMLRLSGITRVVNDRLAIRNRIYERVFDKEWITANVPDAELRRQQAAYRRGLVRATAVAAVILAVMAGLVFAAVVQRNNAQEQRTRAEQQEFINRRLLYAARMNQARETLQSANIKDLLDEARPGPGDGNARGFEWYYLWRLNFGDPSAYSVLRDMGAVSCVAISPDGKLMAVASARQTKLFDIATGEERAALQEHSGPVRSVAFSADSKTLATGSEDKTAKLWDVATRRVLLAFEGHTRAVASVALSPRGGILATAGNDGTAKLWNTTTGKLLVTLTGKLDADGRVAPIRSVAFSPDGRSLATASEDRTAVIWSIAARRPVFTLKRHDGYVLSVSFSPNGKVLATGGEDNKTVLWDTMSGRAISILRGHTGWVWCVQFSPDGTMLATASKDRTAKVWDVTTRQELFTLRGHAEAVRAVSFSPDDKSIATGSTDNTVRIWDAIKARKADQGVSTLLGHSAEVAVVGFSPDGRLLASGSFDKTVTLWDVATKQGLATLKGFNGVAISLAFSRDGKRLVVGAEFGEIKVFDLLTRQEVASWKAHEDAVNSIAFSADNKILASASQDNTVKLWDADALREIAVLKGHIRSVNMAVFSPDAYLLATASDDGTVKLWDVATNQEVGTLQGQSKAVRVIDFSPDGKLLAAGGLDGVIRIWDVAARQIRIELKGHTDYVNALAFSPDGKNLASGSFDQTVKLWGTVSWLELLTLRGHTGYISSVAFSPNGKLLATASQDKTVKLWAAATDEEVIAQSR